MYYLSAKRWIPLLTDIQWPVMPAYIVYPKNRLLLQRCRLFIDVMINHFGKLSYWKR